MFGYDRKSLNLDAAGAGTVAAIDRMTICPKEKKQEGQEPEQRVPGAARQASPHKQAQAIVPVSGQGKLGVEAYAKHSVSTIVPGTPGGRRGRMATLSG
jgi:hypothetical protein